jgi:homoserine acetyltransferase
MRDTSINNSSTSAISSRLAEPLYHMAAEKQCQTLQLVGVAVQVLVVGELLGGMQAQGAGVEVQAGVRALLVVVARASLQEQVRRMWPYRQHSHRIAQRSRSMLADRARKAQM